MIEDVAVSVDAVRKWYPVESLSDVSLMNLALDERPDLNNALVRHMNGLDFQFSSPGNSNTRLISYWVEEEFFGRVPRGFGRRPKYVDQPEEIREKVGDLCLAMVDYYRKECWKTYMYDDALTAVKAWLENGVTVVMFCDGSPPENVRFMLEGNGFEVGGEYDLTVQPRGGLYLCEETLDRPKNFHSAHPDSLTIVPEMGPAMRFFESYLSVVTMVPELHQTYFNTFYGQQANSYRDIDIDAGTLPFRSRDKYRVAPPSNRMLGLGL